MSMAIPSIPDILPAGQVGMACVEHYEVPADQGIRALIRGEYITPGRYAQLRVNGRLMMSDTPMERRSNGHVLTIANGDVLVAGLGIGMILTPLLQNDHVRAVTVVEKYQDVIDLVAPAYSCAKLTVVCADILTWKPAKGQTWDTIYFDIWPDICEGNLDDMAVLHRRFSRRLNRFNPDSYMGSWMREHLVSLRRRSRGRW